MKLYAFTTPDIPKNAGYLKIGETNGSVEKRVEQEGHELNVEHKIVWQDAVLTDRSHIDKRVHRYLAEQGFPIQHFTKSGYDTELVKCTVGELEKAFAVVKEQIYNEELQREEVGKQFYLEIRNWYYWTAKTGDDPYSVAEPEYTLRLIVRLMLCFFLREKEITPTETLVPKELFDEHWLNENLKENEGYRYYNAIIRNLFFHCLNMPMKGRKDFEHSKLIQNVSKVKEQFQKIPFLNGGLFNELPDDDFALDNYHFFAEKHREYIQELDGDYEVEGIVRILSKYQYKLSLDDLLDQAEYTNTIDPEFIGKVFESLLACVDADNKDNRRKVTGSFYTPREIVDYMVNESLDEYLKTNNDLLQCKILDPACGSGAFPCGVMDAVMHRLYSDTQLSSTERYHKKLEILQKVIYGVDIQPMAVQIAVLRLFLSLIQDIKPDKKKDNYGIEPLPNLETKFACANTLLGLKKEKQGRFESPIVKATVKQLQETRNRHFMSSHPQEKNQLREYDETLRKTLSIAMEADGELGHDIALRLAQWNPYDQTKSADFFDPQWMFGIENFDIVIGNPPYIEHKKLKKRAAELKGKFEVFSGTADLSVYFIEQGLNLCNENGQVMFITTNKFFNTGYGALVRKWILKHQIHTLINFEQVKVFETALVSSVILGIKRKKTKDEFTFHQFSKLNRKEFYKQFAELKKNFGTFQQSQLGQGEWTFADNAERELKAKIEKKGKTLGNVSGVAIYRGVTTGYNPAFIIDKTKAKELIQEDKKNAEIIKPLLQGRNIRKWIYNDNKDFLLLTGYDTDMQKQYPSIYRHIKQFRSELKIRADQGKKWYNLRACTYYQSFEKEKIIWGLTADKWAFAYDDKGHYLPSNGYILTSKKVPLKYLLGLLNSKVLQYYFKFIGVMTAGGAFTLKHATITQLPVVIAENTQPLVHLVERRLNGENVDGKIDALVYELYTLTAEEIAIVEEYAK